MNRNKMTIKVASIDVPHIIEHFHQIPYLDTDICYEQYKDFENDISESPCEDCKWAFPYGDVTHEDHFEPDEED